MSNGFFAGLNNHRVHITAAILLAGEALSENVPDLPAHLDSVNRHSHVFQGVTAPVRAGDGLVTQKSSTVDGRLDILLMQLIMIYISWKYGCAGRGPCYCPLLFLLLSRNPLYREATPL